MFAQPWFHHRKITILSWRYDWANTGIGELITFCVYSHVGFVFRPVSRTSYDIISDAITDGKSLDDDGVVGEAPPAAVADGVVVGNGPGTVTKDDARPPGYMRKRRGVERKACAKRTAPVLRSETRVIMELIRHAAAKHAPRIKALCEPAHAAPWDGTQIELPPVLASGAQR